MKGAWLKLRPGMFSVVLITIALLMVGNGTYPVSADAPVPTPDRLAEPEVSDHPTQYEEGRYLYWMHCMPCHGDFGQDLTEDFISLWPEDHQNCWGRGCHGGKLMDEGFPIPKSIPAVISESGEVLAFSTPEDLYEYLQTTHPPQSPGYLEEEEYWAMTSFVFTENNLLDLGREVGPYASVSASGQILRGLEIFLVFLLVGAVIVWVRGTKNDEILDSHQTEG